MPGNEKEKILMYFFRQVKFWPLEEGGKIPPSATVIDGKPAIRGVSARWGVLCFECWSESTPRDTHYGHPDAVASYEWCGWVVVVELEIVDLVCLGSIVESHQQATFVDVACGRGAHSGSVYCVTSQGKGRLCAMMRLASYDTCNAWAPESHDLH
jgi:hypothetical protein